MNRTHILGGVLAAAVLAGGGAALGVRAVRPRHTGRRRRRDARGRPVDRDGARQRTPARSAPRRRPEAGQRAGRRHRPGAVPVRGRHGHHVDLFGPVRAGVASAAHRGRCARDDGRGAGRRSSAAARAPTAPRQVTYDGHPLYYFAGDKAPGDVRGQGIDNFGGGWYVVTPGGDKIDSDDPMPAKPAPASAPVSGNGY